MNEFFFQIVCPSCETSFEVTDPSLLGQIVACPKCGGMMLIAEPEPESNELEAQECETVAESGTSDAESEKDVPDAPSADSRAEDVAHAAPDDDEIDIERERTSRALAITCGVFCAVVLASVVSFIFYFLKTPAPSVGSSEPAVSQPVDPSEEPPLVERDNLATALEEPSVENDADARTDDEDALVDDQTSDSSAALVDVGDSTVDEMSEEENVAVAVEIDDLTPEFESELVIGNQNDAPILDDQDVDPDLTNDEESEDEALDDDSGLNAEFNEAEFAKANQSGNEEETGAVEEDLGAVAMTVDVDAKPALPTLAKPALSLDVGARLKLRLNAIEFPESPAAAVRLLSEFVGVPIEFDLDQLVLLRGSLGRKLDLKLEKVDVETALTKLAEMLKWQVEPQADRVVIRSLDAPGATVEERFDASDLLGLQAPVRVSSSDETPYVQSELTGETLCEFLSSFLPWSPSEEEAVAPLRCENGAVVAVRDGASRKRIETLLAQLRAVKRLESYAAAAPEMVVPETLGWQTLEQKTNFNLFKPTSLQYAIEILETRFHLTVLWDDSTLNTAGLGRDSKTLARIESEPLDRVLFDLLEPLRLTYVILDEKIILITSQERANRYRTVEIHNFADPDVEISEKEIRRLTTEMLKAVAPETWAEPENVIWLDLDSKCWIARQTQPIQREIRRWTKDHARKKRVKASEPAASTGVETDAAPVGELNESESGNESASDVDPSPEE